jgi:TonB family protein
VVSKRALCGRKSLLWIILLSLPATVAAGNKEGIALIERAEQLSSIRTEPFTLKARVKFSEPYQVQGTYVFKWFAAEQWRSDLILPNGTYSRARNGSTGWHSKPEDEGVFLQTTLDQSQPEPKLRVLGHERVGKIEKQMLPGLEVSCVTIKGDYFSSRKLCVDTASGLLLGEKRQGGGYQFGSYEAFRGKKYPAKWQRIGPIGPTLEVEVEELAPLDPSGAKDALTPVVGSEPSIVCEDAIAPSIQYSPDPLFPERARSKGRMNATVVLFLILGANGKPRTVQVAWPAGDGFDEEAKAAVRQWRFRPGLCSGRPAEVQLNVEINFRLQ